MKISFRTSVSAEVASLRNWYRLFPMSANETVTLIHSPAPRKLRVACDDQPASSIVLALRVNNIFFPFFYSLGSSFILYVSCIVSHFKRSLKTESVSTLIYFFLKIIFAYSQHIPICTCSKNKALIWQIRKLRHRSSFAQVGTHLPGFLILRSSFE